MRLFSRLLSATFLLALCLTAGPAAAAGPDIPLTDLDGKPRNLNQYVGHGKWAVVVIWAHECSVCNAEMHEFTAFHQAHHQRDAIVIGVTIDGQEKRDLARGFVARHKLPFVNLVAEPHEEVVEKFGPGEWIGTPTVYVYGPDGTLEARQVGPLTRKQLDEFLIEMTKEKAGAAPAK
jgi:peroxiredoxin